MNLCIMLMFLKAKVKILIILYFLLLLLQDQLLTGWITWVFLSVVSSIKENICK